MPMSLIALKFVLAGLIAMILVGLMWLAAELRYAPPYLQRRVKRAAKWIVVGVALLLLVVFVLPIAGGFLWWSFGK